MDLVCVAGLHRGPVQGLDAPHVVLAQLGGVGLAVEGRHHRARLQGVLQAQHVAKLMSCHLQEVHPFTGQKSKVKAALGATAVLTAAVPEGNRKSSSPEN